MKRCENCLHENTVLVIVLCSFLFQNLFLTNVQGILCHVYNIFFYSGDYYERILNLHLLYKQIETYIHTRLCQLHVSSI